MITDAKRRTRVGGICGGNGFEKLEVTELMVQMINTITTGSECSKNN
jgi:hypothetical protein